MVDGTKLRVYDLNSRQPIAEVAAPTGVYDLGQGNSGVPYAVVKPGTVIFAPYGLVDNACSGTSIDLLNEKALTWQTFPIPCLANGDQFQPKSLWYDTGRRILYVEGEDATTVSNNATEHTPVGTYVEGWNIDTGTLLWTKQLTPCDAASVNEAPLDTPMTATYHDRLVVMCQARSTPSGIALTGQVQYDILVTAPLQLDGSPGPQTLERAVSIDFGSIFDPGKGLVVMASTLPGYDYGAYVMDATTGYFRGFVPTSSDATLNGVDAPRGVGLDAQLGRLYMRTKNGLIASDVRHDPVPVGISYNDGNLVDKESGSQAATQITVDPTRHRLYIPDYPSNSFLVYDDTEPASPEQPTPNPDDATRDLPERPGVTGATYSGAGDAYGAYVLSEGGPGRVADNLDQLCPVQFSSADPTGVVAPMAECPENHVINPGDRAWFFGRVADAGLTNLGASAAAAPWEASDSATAKDMETYGAYGQNVPSVPGASPNPIATSVPGLSSLASPSPTPYPAVPPQAYGFPVDRPQDMPQCSDFGASPAGGGKGSSVGYSKVSCDNKAGSVTGESRFAADGATNPSPSPGFSPGAIDVGAYWSQVTTQKVNGITTTATAIARNVTIPVSQTAGFFFREIDGIAVAKAHGRPGTAAASYGRTFHGFTTYGFGNNYSCNDACDPRQVAAAMTSVFAQVGLNAVAYIPDPDPTYLDGTPKGYQALATKDHRRFESEQKVNDDSSDTVPGLEIVFYDDGNAGRTREIVQFAGVHAEAHYGIYPLSSGDESFNPPPVDTAPDSGVTDTVGTAPPTVVQQMTAPPTHKENRIAAAIHRMATAIQEGWRLLVSDPKTAAMLAGVWGLLGLPVYLAVRRRSLLNKIAKGVA